MSSRSLGLCILAVAAGPCLFGQGTDPSGFPTSYLVLGPYPNPAGANPSEELIRADYLCDGEVDQESIAPRVGLELGAPDPDCAQASGSDCSGPTVELVAAPNTTLDLNGHFLLNDLVMAYAWVWVENLTGDTIAASLGVASDDSFELLVNGESVGLESVPRGCGEPGQIQNEGYPAVLEPGPNLVGMKVFEGGGGWCGRFRLLDVDGAPITDDGIRFRISTDLEGEVRATRSILGATPELEVLVELEGDVPGSRELVERFHPSWTVEEVSGGGEVEAGAIRWADVPGDSVSYTLTREGDCSPDVATIEGRVTTSESSTAVGGEGVIPGCELSLFVPEVLVTPPFELTPGFACALTRDDLDRDWLTGVTVDGDDLTDRDFVPDEGLEFSPDFDVLASLGFTDLDAFARERFWVNPAERDATEARLVAVSTANGIFDWQAAYGPVDQSMNAAFFYVVNDSEAPRCVQIGFGSDDSASIRVNGYPVFGSTGCRGHPGFTDKARFWLDPGKNLVAFYTFEGGGGYNACLRFEDRTGAPIALETTLDATGYDPDDHAPPAPGCSLEGAESLSPQGFVTRFLVPALPLEQGVGADAPAGADSGDYLSILEEGESRSPSLENVFEGAIVGPGASGLISTGVRGEEDTTRLTVFRSAGGADPGLFNGELFYGPVDNYSSTGFVFLENRTARELTAYLSFASDDSAHLYLDGEIVLEHLGGRGFGPANATQNGPAEVRLAPGFSLVQLSYVEGGGGSGFRLRLTRDCRGTQTFAPAELGVTLTTGRESGSAERRVAARFEGASVLAEVTVDVSDGAGPVSLVETPSEVWRVSDISAGGRLEDGAIVWSDRTERRFRYTLRSDGPCSRETARLAGTILLTDARLVEVRGSTGVSLCDAPTFVPRVLLTPAFVGPGCNPGDTLSGPWLEDGTGLEGERSIVPEEGLVFLPDFGGESQALGLDDDPSAAAQALFTEGGEARLAPVLANANGLYDFQAAAIYGADVNDAMNVAFFYVENEAPEARLVHLGLGSDDSVAVRVNGHLAYSNAVCRGHGAFPDKFVVRLDPGKNLVSVYTFEGGGGFGMCIRFENDAGEGVFLPTTLDPEGYDPEDHPPPPSIGISPLGYVTRYLVPAHPLDQIVGQSPPAEALPDDYLQVEGEEPSVDNVLAGAEVTEGFLGNITTSVRSPTGSTELVVFEGPIGDPTFNGEAFYGDAPDNYSSTGFFYLVNRGLNRSAWIGFASDDGAHLYVNGATVGGFSGGRGFGGPNSIQDGPFEVELEPGPNLVQLSYVEGGGGSGFRVGVWADPDRRETFLDASAVSLCLDPECVPEGGGDDARFVRGDADGSGQVNLTDAIFVLNFLFLGGPRSACEDAADPDNSGRVTITDGILLLNFLFLGGPPPAFPFPDCGVDTGGGSIGCVRSSRDC